MSLLLPTRGDLSGGDGVVGSTPGGSVKHKPTTIRDRLGALWGLLTISDDDYDAYMRSYGWHCVGQKPAAAT